MTRTDESFEERLARMGVESEGIGPRADFAHRVMARVEAQAPSVSKEDWSVQVLRRARVGMAVAMMAAVAGVVLAWDSTNSADQEEALAYGIAEAFE